MKILTTCGAIILNDAGQLLLVRRSSTDKYRPLQWDLPGGHVEQGENFETALVREVHEETGLNVSPEAARLVYAVSGTFPEVSVTWLFFLVRNAQGDIKLSYEHDDSKWVSLEEAIELVKYDRKRSALEYVRDNEIFEG